MHGTGPSQSYSTSAKLLHWGFIGVFAYGIFKQVDDLSQLEDPNFLRFEFIFACVFLALLALRLWIMRGQGSALPAAAPVWNRMAAKLVHFGMYVALMAIGVSGLAIGVVFTLG
ncbi:cytochrome b/b6 domain-containing protein, partial [uncultured Planktomarina sp.]